MVTNVKDFKEGQRGIKDGVYLVEKRTGIFQVLGRREDGQWNHWETAVPAPCWYWAVPGE
jgi:hypothetical protein